MENIVTGQDNDPRQELQQERPNIPRGTQTTADGAQSDQSGASVGNVMGSLPLSAQQPPQETTGVGFDSHIPAVSVGVPPWLEDNARTGVLLPDIPNYQEMMRQNVPVPRQPQVTGIDTPSPFRTIVPPQVGNDTLQRLGTQFDSAIRERNQLELHSRLRQFIDFRPWRYVDTTSEPSAVSTSIPSSTSTVTDRLYSPFGIGSRGRSGDILTSNPVVSNLGEQVGAAARTVGGLGQDLFEFVTGNKDGQLFNNTVREGSRFIESISGAPDPNNPGQYQINPLRGYFGEMGRGWAGAANYIFNLPQQIVMSSVYSTLDLGIALNQAMPSLQEWVDGAPPIDMTQVNMPDEFNQPFYRYGQAFSGVDLDLVNMRDGSGNRYLSMIPVDRPLGEQLGWGGLAFLGSLAIGGNVDDLVSLGIRRTPTAIDAIRRLENPIAAVRAAETLEQAQAARRAYRPVPTFNPVEQAPLERAVGNAPGLDYDVLIRQASERGDTAEAARLVRESAQRAREALETPPAINSPTEMAQALDVAPQISVPPPVLVNRSNEQLSHLARQAGILKNDSTLSNEQVDVLAQIFPDVFSRYGNPVEIGENVPGLAIRATDDPVEAARLARESARLIREQNDELRSMLLKNGEVPESAIRRAEQIVNLPPGERVSIWGDEVPDYLRVADEGFARQVLESDDIATAASRGMQQLEGEIENLRFEILRQGTRLNKELSNYVRGNVADEIQTWAQHGRIVPGTQVQELLPPEVPNLTGTIQKEWYHGTRQSDLFGVNFAHGTPHEYGIGLYLTDSPDYARVAARSSRTPNNPVPGTTRLAEGGIVNTVRPEVRNPLVIGKTGSIDTSRLQEIRDAFIRALRDTTGDDALAKKYSRMLGEGDIREAWVSARQVYAESTGTRIPELLYRGFSTQVSNSLRELGYDGVLDPSRGILVALPDLAGRVRGVAVPIESVPPPSKIQQTFARHWMDAEVAASIRSPVTEANELQSRLALENSLMEDLVSRYNMDAPEAMKATQNLIEAERAAIASRRAARETEIAQAVRNAPDAAMETPDFQPFKNTDMEEPCL